MGFLILSTQVYLRGDTLVINLHYRVKNYCCFLTLSRHHHHSLRFLKDVPHWKHHLVQSLLFYKQAASQYHQSFFDLQNCNKKTGSEFFHYCLGFGKEILLIFIQSIRKYINFGFK